MSEKVFRQYRAGIRRLLAMLGKDNPRVAEVLVLQHRLIQNMEDTATLGPSATLETSRARILESCNRLSHALVDKSFYALCGLSPEQARKGTGVLSGSDKERPLIDVYFEKMSNFLQSEVLRSPKASTQVREAARKLTFAALHDLNGAQKGHVVQFLYEAGLITEGPGVVFMSGANLIEVHLEGAVLIEAHMAGADLSSAYLDAAHLEWARFGEACLVHASLKRAFLVAAHLAGAKLGDAHLEGAHLLGANLSGAELVGAHLDGAQMQWASLLTTNLSGACLAEANLVGADLQSANMASVDLCGANLEDARLAWVRLRGATYDNRTCWPEGFDPIGAGAIKIEP